jgi:homoserine O-acetyltransferase/O-succinyltransferase
MSFLLAPSLLLWPFSHHTSKNEKEGLAMKRKVYLIALWLCLGGVTVWAQAEQQFAELGAFKTTGGVTIPNCRLGYRTIGTLNAEKTNAVLFPTWFNGKSEQLLANAGKDKLVDSSRFFVIFVDALGNGISSSPSNSPDFPAISIRDMVNAEYELVTKTFGIKKLYAVMGISMGGMQTFEWLVAYPEMMERAVPIVGTPQQSTYDKLLWTTQLKAIEDARRLTGNAENAMAMVARLHALALSSPSFRNQQTPTADFDKFIQAEEKNYQALRADNWAAQLKAMIAHDVARNSGSLAQAAWRVKAKLFVVVERQDHMVNPDSALEFARYAKAEALEVTGNCGHLFASCDNAAVVAAVQKFLNQ